MAKRRPLVSTTKLQSETNPWELKITFSDIIPEIVTKTSVQLTILEMTTHP